MKLRTYYIIFFLLTAGIVFCSVFSLHTRTTTIERYKNSLDLRAYQPAQVSLVFDEYFHTDTIFLNNTHIKFPTHQFWFSDKDYSNFSVDQFLIGCPHLSNQTTDNDYIALKQICSMAGVELSTLLNLPNFLHNLTYIYAEKVYIPIVKQVFGKTIYLKPENENYKSIIESVKLNDCGLIKDIYLNNGVGISFKSKDDSTYCGNFRSFAADVDTVAMYERYYRDLKHFSIFPPSKEEVLHLVNSHIEEALSSLNNERFYGYPQSSETHWSWFDRGVDLPYRLRDVENLLFLLVISLVTVIFFLYRKQRWLKRLNVRLEYVLVNYPKCSTLHKLPSRYNDFDVPIEIEVLLSRSDEFWRENEDSLILQEKQKREADELKKKFPNGYLALRERSNVSSNIEIIENAGLIKDEEEKYRQQLRITYADASQDLANIEGRFSRLVNDAKIALNQGNLEVAKHNIEESREILNQRAVILSQKSQIADRIKIATGEDLHVLDRSEELQIILTDTISNIDASYVKGVLVAQDRLYVHYNSENSALKQDDQDWSYPYVRFPSYGCVVFPHRRRKIARRGYMEARFEEMLRYTFASDILDVIGDANILLTDGCRPYEPDIAIVEKSVKYNLRIDIEIDEPYAGLTRQATHYIGCGDYTRDMNLVSAGWIVVRLNEEAIVMNPDGCLSYIAQIIEGIIPTYKRPERLKCNYQTYPRWSEIEAKIMAANDYRESYLGIKSFGEFENGSLQGVDIIQTEAERNARKEIKAHFVSNVKPKNLDKSRLSFENDKRLAFEPSEHTYIYDGTIEFRAVSNIISLFFDEFDAVSHAVRMGIRDGVSPDYYLELWDRKGCLSREVGTFMHQQIENIIKGKKYKNKYRFKYHDDIEEVDIQTEIDFFLSFMEESDIHPFRTEWAICDNEYRIAGTIDCLCKNGETFEIYDWKRSSKIVDYWGCPILENNWGHMGCGPIKHIHDTSFWKYALQQNIYKLILEKNYGLKISAMKLVVLHSDYNEPYVLTVPNLETEVIKMLEIVKRNVI